MTAADPYHGEQRDTMQTQRHATSSNVRLDFPGGGWVIVLAAVLMAALVAWHVVPAIRHGRTPFDGAGGQQAFSGFDLSLCKVPREQIVVGMPRDTLLPLDNPEVVSADQIGAINRKYRKYLLPADRVIGVVIGGRARAYPLRVLNWHEVCNDALAGQPIAVTYNPLCDSAVVFDRRVNGRELRLAVSGLLYNSNLLMYDTEPAHQAESLWSQLRFEAIAGQAAIANATLAVLPAQVVYWGDWKERYPHTDVLVPNPANLERYNRDPYASYYNRGMLRYAVASSPGAATMPAFTPVVTVEVEGRYRTYSLPEIAAGADAGGRWAATFQGRLLRFTYRQVPPNPPTVWVEGDHDAEPIRFVQSLWFAWHATHP
jgi:hypothetical protein